MSQETWGHSLSAMNTVAISDSADCMRAAAASSTIGYQLTALGNRY
jgi:hypothetical protein